MSYAEGTEFGRGAGEAGYLSGLGMSSPTIGYLLEKSSYQLRKLSLCISGQL